MTTAITTTGTAAAYAEASKAKATWQSYRRGWLHWSRWCALRRRDPGPPVSPDELAAYLAESAGGAPDWPALRPSSLRVYATAIRVACQLRGAPDPWTDQVRAVWKGIWRVHAGADQRQAAPLLADQLRAALDQLARRDDAHAWRDRLALLLGWHGALRSAELVALRHHDVTRDAHGLLLRLARSKSHQNGAELVGVPFGLTPRHCAVATWERWRSLAPGAPGDPLLREVRGHAVRASALSPRGVTRLVQRAARACGVDPSAYSSHSLRAGAATSMHLAGRDVGDVAAQLRHASVDTTMVYLRDPDRSKRPTAGLL